MRRDMLTLMRRLLREGAAPRDAAEAAGVAPGEFDRLMKEDAAFARAVARAEAECAAQMERAVVCAASKEWRAADAWLKRRRGAREAQPGADGSGPTGLQALKSVVVEGAGEVSGDGDGPVVD